MSEKKGVITHISTVCTSCDWIPYYDCPEWNDGNCPILKEKLKKNKKRTESA